MTRDDVNAALQELAARANAIASIAWDAVENSDACGFWHSTFSAGNERLCESMKTARDVLSEEATALTAKIAQSYGMTDDAQAAAFLATLQPMVDHMASTAASIADASHGQALPPSIDAFVESGKELARKIGELAGGAAGTLLGGAAGGAIGGAGEGLALGLGVPGWLVVAGVVYLAFFTPAGKKLLTGGVA